MLIREYNVNNIVNTYSPWQCVIHTLERYCFNAKLRNWCFLYGKILKNSQVSSLLMSTVAATAAGYWYFKFFLSTGLGIISRRWERINVPWKSFRLVTDGCTKWMMCYPQSSRFRAHTVKMHEPRQCDETYVQTGTSGLNYCKSNMRCITNFTSYL